MIFSWNAFIIAKIISTATIISINLYTDNLIQFYDQKVRTAIVLNWPY